MDEYCVYGQIRATHKIKDCFVIFGYARDLIEVEISKEALELKEDQERGLASRRRNKKIGLGSLIDLVSGSVELHKPSKFKQALTHVSDFEPKSNYINFPPQNPILPSQATLYHNEQIRAASRSQKYMDKQLQRTSLY
ncbi:hypothetical protein GQ457_06G010180 [Hibiscus cannabinus]